MPTYRIHYRPELGYLDETVHADRLADEDDHVVLYTTAWIAGQPREVVARRIERTKLAVIRAQGNE